MNTGVISARYAKALLCYAKESGAEESVYYNMRQLIHALNSVRELRAALRNPRLSLDERVGLLCAAVEPSVVFRDFAALVLGHGREDMLLFIAHAYIAQYRKDKGIYAAKFVTASPVSESFRQQVLEIIEERLHADVELECATDASLVGGFVIEANCVRLDSSVKGKLAGIRKSLVKQNRKLV